MKHIFTLLSFIFIANLGISQDYDDLKILYADANYEKLVKVCEKYTLSDKTKKDVMPYIWFAKGLYKISLSSTPDEKYKNAYKDAIKYLSKGIKYDLKYNDGATIEDEREFIDEFQMSLVETIDGEMAAGNFKKAYSWTIKYQKITVNLIGAKYMMGAEKYFDQDKTTARAMWKEGAALLEEVTGIDDWSEADRQIFKLGILHSAAALNKSRQGDKAKALLGKTAQWFEDDEDWEELYDEIVNI